MDVSIKEDSLRSEALDVVVQLLFELDEKREQDDFYDRICEAVCLQTSMERAVLFLYDAERRLVLPAGSHGVFREFIAHGYGTLEETPIAQRALAEDRVVETTDLANDVPARYSNLPGVTKLTCTPVAAAGRWLGVIFADREAALRADRPGPGRARARHPTALWHLDGARLGSAAGEKGSRALRRRDQGGNRRPPRGADRLRGEVGDRGS